MNSSPRSLGKYELQERLGRGGMAEVWKAFDPQLKRYVAIKRGVDELVARRQIVVVSPVELPFDPDIVLDPDAPQDLDCRDFT
jgi:serine/threonine protein kinase